jgi:hypothetical protein
VKRKLALTLAAAGLMASTANATPKDVAQYVFPTAEECMAALNTFWRGNHAFYCQAGPGGWQIAYDEGYEAAKKGPKNK